MKKILLTLSLVLIISSIFAEVIWSDDFETATGWNLTGEFEIGAPQGLGGQYGNADPAVAFQGTNVLGNDLSGDGDYGASIADHGETAISPAIDCSSSINTQLSFMKWLNVETSEYDHAYLDLSVDNGANWIELWTNNGGVEDAEWNSTTFDIAALADGASQVKIRFSIGVTDGSWFYSGWNVDNLVVSGDVAELAHVSGTITQVGTEELLAGVEVMGNIFSTTTDADGNYDFDVVTGENTLNIRFNDHFEIFYEIDLAVGASEIVDFEMELYSPPENLMAEEVTEGVILSWEAPEYQPQLLSVYNIYRDSVLLETISGTTYSDFSVIADSYEYYVTAVYTFGASIPSNTVVAGTLDAGDNLLLTNSLGNYPNPFNPTTTIKFALVDGAADCQLDIYNSKGQIVKSWDYNNVSLGKHSVSWNGEDEQGKKQGSGIYFYRLSVDNKTLLTKKMVMMK